MTLSKSKSMGREREREDPVLGFEATRNYPEAVASKDLAITLRSHTRGDAGENDINKCIFA
jgi:hypothetical protein